MSNRPKEIVILGSTGSIGTQALAIIRQHPEKFKVVGLTAGGGNPELFTAQVAEFGPKFAGVGEEASITAAGMVCDRVLNGITGAVGLRPTLAALQAGNILALANKESLIIGGSLVTDLAGEGQLIPVDSEHSALAQCLRAGRIAEVSQLVLTASGGPFRGRNRADLANVSVAEALNHPNWDMGPVVTINSATLVNKGLEVIEAQLLFGLPMEKISVVVHPPSVVHSMVEFYDGTTMAQASPPTMMIPISLGLDWPNRVPNVATAVDWKQPQTWEFYPLDNAAFPAVELARKVGAAGGVLPAIYNAANEVAVQAFRDERLPFLGIVDLVEQVVNLGWQQQVESKLTLAAVLAADNWARDQAAQLIQG